MDEERKYFGMTRVQIGILAGLAGVLLIIICVGVWLISRGGGLGAAGSSVPTVVPTVTSIVATPPTLTPTITPTPIPYEQLVPADWKQYKTSLVEIWAPNNFKLADQKTVDNLTKTGSAIPAIVLTEVSSKSSLYIMVIAVSYEPLVGDSLDSFLDSELDFSAYQARVTDRRVVFVNSKEVRRIVVEARVNNVDANELIYVFLDGSTVWYVQYAAEISEFFNNLSVFEQSITTFRPASY